jgi:TIR domain
MATHREYFEKDSSRYMSLDQMRTSTEKMSGAADEVISRVAFDFEAGVKFVFLYIPDSPVAIDVINHHISNIEEVLKVTDITSCGITFQGTDEYISSDDLGFSGRVMVYTGAKIAPETKEALRTRARDKGLGLLIRDGAYLDERMKRDVPQAFICHDSRDKEPFVQKLASQLQSLLFSVWYDEYSLKAGDSLRTSIEKGLKECRKCILILSPNFLNNDGWTKAEFDSIFTREILEKEQIMIPVWHGVTKEEVFNYSPRLLDKVGIPSSLGEEEVARRIVHAMPL